MSNYTQGQDGMIAQICASDGVYWNFYGFVLPRSLKARTKSEAGVLCNDVFKAGEDEEPIKANDVAWLHEVYDLFGDLGLIAWVAFKRKKVPLGTNHPQFPWLVDAVGELRKAVRA